MAKYIEKHDGTVQVETDIKLPLSVYERFKDYARNTTGGCYWLAVKDLLAKGEIFNTVSMLQIDLSNVSERVAIIEQELEEGRLEKAQKQQEKKPITLGKNPMHAD